MGWFRMLHYCCLVHKVYDIRKDLHYHFLIFRLTREQALLAIETGMALVRDAREAGFSLLATGEMGIGNTTTSSAVLCALSGKPVEAVTGRGGGLTDAAFLKKKQVIEQALAINTPDGKSSSPRDSPSSEGGAGASEGRAGVRIRRAKRAGAVPRLQRRT